MITYEFLRKSKTLNKGLSIFLDQESMLITIMNYNINLMKIPDYPNSETVIFSNIQINTWEDSLDDLKTWVLKNKKGEILVLSSPSPVKINDLKKFIGKILIK